jgi:HK97 gp10 family phage protein
MVSAILREVCFPPLFTFLSSTFPIVIDIMPIEIEGLAKLSDILSEMAPRKAKRRLRNALGKGADLVQETAEKTAPVEFGTLEKDIIQKSKFSDDDDNSTTALTISIGPSSKVFWGMFQEFGTQDVEGIIQPRTVTFKSGAQATYGWQSAGKHFHHTAQVPQRWLTNAWIGCKDEVLNVVSTELIGLLMDLENE